MSSARAVGKLHVWMIALLLAAAATSASASTILVREELGFGFVTNGVQWTLEEDGPSAIWDLRPSYDPGAIFELRYADDQFLMTALGDNGVFDHSIAFGLDIYPGNVTPISPLYDCLNNDPCYNGLGFIAFYDIPHLAGQTVTVEVPPQAAVAEPPSLPLVATTLIVLIAFRRGTRATENHA